MTEAITFTKPSYPADEEALAAMAPVDRARFEIWMRELEAEHKRDGFAYGDGSLWEMTGAECWLDYFKDGMTAREALDADA